MVRWLRCVFVLLALGCTRDATQLVVVVGSDLPADAIRTVRIRVWPIDDANPSVDGREPTAEHRFEIAPAPDGVRVAVPFSLGVLPPRDESDRVELHTDALDGDGNVTVTRSTRVGFVEEQSLRLPVFLSSLCRDVMCPSGQTCIEGTCQSNEVDESDLEAATPGLELASDGGAGAPDAGPSTIPDTVSPTFAIGTGTLVSFKSGRAFLLSDGDLLLYARGDTPAPPELAAGVMGFGLFVARYAPDGTQRWVRRWMLPGTAVANDLQGNGVSAAQLSEGTIYACGSVRELGLTDAADGRAWSGVARGAFLPSDMWVARLDGATGAITALSTISLDVGLGDGDVGCSGLVATSTGVIVLAHIPSFPGGDAEELLLDGTPIAAAGPTPTDGALLHLSPGADAFTVTAARNFGASGGGQLVAGEPDVAWLVLEGSSASLGGLLASEPSPPADAFQSLFLYRIDADGAPIEVAPIAHTDEQFSQALVASGGGRVFAIGTVTNRTAGAPGWIEIEGEPRIEGLDLVAGEGVELIAADFDATSGDRRGVIGPITTSGTRVQADADGAGNLYLAGRHPAASTQPLPGVTPPPIDGREDAFIIRYDVTDTLTPRWEQWLSDTTSEMTYGDTIDSMDVSARGEILVSGQTSASGIDLGAAGQPAGVWFALLR